MNWLEMTPQQRGKTLNNMQMYGGDFAKALAVACIAADTFSEVRLMSVFPDIIERYSAMEVKP